MRTTRGVLLEHLLGSLELPDAFLPVGIGQGAERSGSEASLDRVQIEVSDSDHRLPRLDDASCLVPTMVRRCGERRADRETGPEVDAEPSVVPMLRMPARGFQALLDELGASLGLRVGEGCWIDAERLVDVTGPGGRGRGGESASDNGHAGAVPPRCTAVFTPGRAVKSVGGDSSGAAVR